MSRVLLILIAVIVAVVSLSATPLPVSVRDTQAFRHLLEDHDFLVISRYQLVPLEEDATDDFTDVTVDASGNLDDMVLVNRHINTDTTDMTVTDDASSTDITANCTLGADQQTVRCTGTGLGSGDRDFTIEYLNGWNAYSGTDAIYTLSDQNSTVVSQRGVADTGFALVALYVDRETKSDSFTGDNNTTDFALSFRHFYTDETGMTVTVDGVAQVAGTDYNFDSVNNEVDFVDAPKNGEAIAVTYPYTGGLIWGDGGITAQLEASPNLWAAPSSSSPTITFNATSTQDETETSLTSTLRDMLRRLELADSNVDNGEYVSPTGITDAGQVIALNAWNRIVKAVPTAFLTASFNPFSDLEVPDQSFADQIDTDAGGTDVGGAMDGLGQQFGLSTGSGDIMGMIIVSILAVAVAMWVRNRTESAGLSVMAVWIIFLGAWIMGAVPALIPAIMGVFIAAVGLLVLVQKKIFA